MDTALSLGNSPQVSADAVQTGFSFTARPLLPVQVFCRFYYTPSSFPLSIHQDVLEAANIYILFIFGY